MHNYWSVPGRTPTTVRSNVQTRCLPEQRIGNSQKRYKISEIHWCILTIPNFTPCLKLEYTDYYFTQLKDCCPKIAQIFVFFQNIPVCLRVKSFNFQKELILNWRVPVKGITFHTFVRKIQNIWPYSHQKFALRLIHALFWSCTGDRTCFHQQIVHKYQNSNFYSQS